MRMTNEIRKGVSGIYLVTSCSFLFLSFFLCLQVTLHLQKSSRERKDEWVLKKRLELAVSTKEWMYRLDKHCVQGCSPIKAAFRLSSVRHGYRYVFLSQTATNCSCRSVGLAGNFYRRDEQGNKEVKVSDSVPGCAGPKVFTKDFLSILAEVFHVNI